jgi:hypothetical protein
MSSFDSILIRPRESMPLDRAELGSELVIIGVNVDLACSNLSRKVQ